MKYLRRYLSLLFALVMCVGLFSVTAHAERSEEEYLKFETWSYLEEVNGAGSWSSGSYTSSSPYAYVYTDTALKQQSVTIGGTAIANMKDFKHTFHVSVAPYGVEPLLYENDSVCEVKINDIYYSFLTTSNSSSSANVYYREPNNVKALVFYANGNTEYFDVLDYYVNGYLFSCSFEFAPEEDVSKIELIVEQSIVKPVGLIWKSVTFYLGKSSNTPLVVVDVPSKEEGLLSGLLGKVTDGFQNVKEGFSSLIDGIANLPKKIMDGITSLFVPSEESMLEYQSKWDELLSLRLGAVYQVVNILTDSWDGVMQAHQTNTIEFPSATINFFGTQFTFGGYDVKIIPDGFDVLVTAIKSIVAIVCTVAFVNGLRKRYEEIMGVEQ